MEHLIGMLLPALALISTSGASVDVSTLRGLCVLFCYPYTGQPTYSNPPGWDDIPGAHGSTPQALAYSKLYEEFRRLGVKVFGLSFQDTEWQRDFIDRNGIAYPLLSDAKREFARALALPVFRAGDDEFLRRLTIIAQDGRIVHVRCPVEVPEQDAVDVLNWLQARTPPSASWAPPP